MSTSNLEFSRGDVIASKYEVIDLLDESPLGFSYRVKHLKSGKYVRLTMLRPKIAGREHKEQVLDAFKRARDVQHNGLIKVGELAEHDGVAYYTMEDFEGQTLRELLQEYKIEGKQFAVKEAAHVVIQVCEALAAAHAADIVFRGLRPEYVLISVRRTGPRRQNFVAQVKLIGSAFWDLVPAGILAEDEFTRGEAQYLAPELKSFEPQPTPRCDVYSAGVILYEMLTGSAPVGTFQLPGHVRPDLPKHVNDVVELALANAPEDRYPSSRDFIADIQRIFQEVATQPDTDGSTPWLSIAGWSGALLVVAAIAIAVFMWGRETPEQRAEKADALVRTTVISEQAAQTPSADEVAAILAQQPPNMAYIPAGPYVSGRLNAEFDALATEPLAEVVEVDAFLIDVFEYPNLQGAKPVFSVSWDNASRMCQEAGKRLCTENEWEKACKGPPNYVYSYGDTYDPAYCRPSEEDGGSSAGIYLSGAMPECRSNWQVYDMSGNFMEWTKTAPKGNADRRRVKGGHMTKPEQGTRCAFATDFATNYSDSRLLSFRCCRDLDAEPWSPPTEEGEAEGEPAPE